MSVEVLGEVARYVNDPEGEWVRSEFPHPLVTVDYDAADNVIAVSVVLTWLFGWGEAGNDGG